VTLPLLQILVGVNELSDSPMALILGIQPYFDVFHEMKNAADITDKGPDGFRINGYLVVPDARMYGDFAVVPESRIRSQLQSA